MQESTKTSSGWVAAVPNEVQRGGGRVPVNARLWHNLSSQKTRCKVFVIPFEFTCSHCSYFGNKQKFKYFIPPKNLSVCVDGVAGRAQGAWLPAEDAEGWVGCAKS